MTFRFLFVFTVENSVLTLMKRGSIWQGELSYSICSFSCRGFFSESALTLISTVLHVFTMKKPSRLFRFCQRLYESFISHFTSALQYEAKI